ncbi:MAG: hypothetical protein K2X27_13145 [Candidatus Obscuribacterales bacterium]|nr:hypothetical protein [Candidatus Obscuribacterales bacterium]
MEDLAIEENVATSTTGFEEKPENGIKGLKHWKHDMLAGLVVALVSVPLSIGIAIASGVPPICGITSEIIAGLVFPFIGGAYVTVSGPAAGLAPVIMSSILQLGHNDPVIGYHRVICVIMMVGLFQIVLTFMKAAKFSHLFPSAAIQGMLTSIGMMLAMKQIPNFIGHKYLTHEFFDMVMETPSEIVHVDWTVLCTSLFCLVVLFLLSSLKTKFLKLVPPQLIVVVIGAAIASFVHIDPKFLVHAPANPFEHGIVVPDFAALFADRSIWGAIFSCVLLLAFVDGTESLATIHAVDRIDPFHRKSNPDKTLLAMGISNICSALIGGITIIPGIIKSTTCIVSGARTAWINFYNALFLIAFLVYGAKMIDMIPLGALSAVLVHIGYKLAGPHKWRYIASIGKEQLLVYLCTILVTLKTDLLIGIFAGMLVKALIVIFYVCRSSASSALLSDLMAVFKSPVLENNIFGNEMYLLLQGPLTCFNSLWLRKILDSVPQDVEKVRVQLGSGVSVVDHSVSLYLLTTKGDLARAGKTMEIVGLEALQSCSAEPTAFKFRQKKLDASVASA